ncbi:MAG TPA: RDD family protein [Candidatus Cybelea sp.]
MRQRTGVCGTPPSNLAGVDRMLEVRTPESIAFNYELAGLGSRFLALIVDQAIQILTLVAIFAGILLAGARAAQHRSPAVLTDKLAESLAIALVVAILFIVLFGYFIAFEALWNGQTPGKKLLGLRVVRDGGYPIDFGASLIRNLIRVGEQLVGYYLLAAVSALVSPENKRLGDLAAGTIVVRDARLAPPRDFSQRAEPEPAYSPTAYLSGEERALVKRFLERRSALSPERRQELAAQLASRVRDRVPVELARLDDEALLERL